MFIVYVKSPFNLKRGDNFLYFNGCWVYICHTIYKIGISFRQNFIRQIL